MEQVFCKVSSIILCAFRLYVAFFWLTCVFICQISLIYHSNVVLTPKKEEQKNITLMFVFSPLQNTRETAHAIRKLPLVKAKRYLEDVLVHKQAIPFTRFCRGVGRTAQAKNRHSNGQGRWPVKSAKFILDLLKNAESNAEVCFTFDVIFCCYKLSSVY